MFRCADTVQKGIAVDPDSLSSAAGASLRTGMAGDEVWGDADWCIGQGAESAMLIASLKDVIRNQAKEIDTLRSQLQELTAAAQKPDDVRLSPSPSFLLTHAY